MSWITDVFDNSIIINSKISLSRNIKEIPFTNKLEDNVGRKNVNDVENIIYSNREVFNGFKFIKLWQDEENLSSLSYEKLLIDYQVIKNSTKSGFGIDRDETITIMVNGDNHLKFQYISSELDLEKGFNEISKIDYLFEENLRYAFDENLGYLTNNIMELGLGLEISVMIHLPALKLNKKIKNLTKEILKLDIYIEEVFDESIENCSNIYKIYNTKSIGLSEKNIIAKFKTVVEQIILKEQLEREILFNNFKFKVFDNVFRSYGILKNSHIISQEEAFKLLSSVRMGIEMSIINNIDKKILNKLLVNMRLSALKNIFKNNINGNGDIERAQYIRDNLPNNL